MPVRGPWADIAHSQCEAECPPPQRDMEWFAGGPAGEGSRGGPPFPHPFSSFPEQLSYFVRRAGSLPRAVGAGQGEEGQPCWPSQVLSGVWTVRRGRRPRGGTGPQGVRRVVAHGGCPTTGVGGPVERRVHGRGLAWGSEPRRVRRESRRSGGPLPGVSPGGSLSEARGSDKDDSNLAAFNGSGGMGVNSRLSVNLRSIIQMCEV